MVAYLESRVELSLCERRSGVFRTALTGSSQLPPADRCSSEGKQKQDKYGVLVNRATCKATIAFFSTWKY